MDIILKSKTYEIDKQLFQELGLREFHFEGIQREYVLVGRTKYEGVKVEIFVSTMPSQFWKFEFVFRKKKYVIETGSGSLSDYWNFVKQIIEGMVVITVSELE